MWLIAVAVLIGLGVGWLAPELSHRICDIELKVPKPLAALAGAIVVGAPAWAVGPNAAMPAFIYLGAVGTLLALIDIEVHRLPDKLTLASYPIVAALLLIPAIADGQWGAYGRAWLGALAMFAFYLALALIYPAGMGMGDVKLAGVLGLGLGFLGWPYVIVGLFAAFLLGAVIGIALMIFGKAGRKTAVPFGPFMIAGAIVAMMFAQELVDWYLLRATGA